MIHGQIIASTSQRRIKSTSNRKKWPIESGGDSSIIGQNQPNQGQKKSNPYPSHCGDFSLQLLECNVAMEEMKMAVNRSGIPTEFRIFDIDESGICCNSDDDFFE